MNTADVVRATTRDAFAAYEFDEDKFAAAMTPISTFTGVTSQQPPSSSPGSTPPTSPISLTTYTAICIGWVANSRAGTPGSIAS